jgi:hypothetical protein
MNSTSLPLTLAVVGHTNTGKTSLLRTLLRNTEFGEVQDSAGTTRHVEAAQLLLHGQPYIELRDTPGLEDSVALSRQLQVLQQQDLRSRACLEHFIHKAQTPIAAEFEQEIKVLRQALECHAMLYVIDCREEVLEKYRQEIFVLSLASRPILPVLNFIQGENSQLQTWRAALAELGLHALVEFDTVAFDFEAEKRLYQKLQTLLEAWHQPLQTLLEHRSEEWRQMRSACITQVANMLVEMATITMPLQQNSSRSLQLQNLQNRVRQREQECLNAVLELLHFSAADVELSNLPVQNGEWQLDLFSPETLKTFGLDAASAAAAGAAVGLGIDLMLAGMSLGAATLTGAAVGTAWHTGRRYGKDLLARLRGDTILCVDDITLNLLLLRQLSLLRHLFQRGHAAVTPVQVDKDQKPTPEGWEEQVRKMRGLLMVKAGIGSFEYRSKTEDLRLWLEKSI